MLVPIYGFVHGDTIGLLALVHDHDRVADLVSCLQQAASIRVAPRLQMQATHCGRVLNAGLTVAEAGLQALDRVDVVPEEVLLGLA